MAQTCIALLSAEGRVKALTRRGAAVVAQCLLDRVGALFLASECAMHSCSFP